MSYTDKNTLRETVDRGASVIPFYIYHHHWHNYTLYLHWHNEFEVIYVEKGSALYIVDTVPIKVSEGQCIIINSGQLHSACTMEDESCVHYALLFDLNLLNSMPNDYIQNNYINPLLEGDYSFPLLVDEYSEWGKTIIIEIKEAIRVYNSGDFGWEMGIKAFLFKLLSITAGENKFIFKNTGKLSSLKNKIEIVKKSINYIQNNYSKRIYIEELAKEVKMNPQYFCRFFKLNTGKTPVDFINQYRIEQAVRMIIIGDKKISDICLEVGFDNFSYFIKKFKEYKNCTPSKYSL